MTGEDLAEEFTRALGRPVQFRSLTPDDYEQSLVPVFGPTVAREVAAQVRCIVSLGSGAVEMDHPRAELSVPPTPLSAWIAQHNWA